MLYDGALNTQIENAILEKIKKKEAPGSGPRYPGRGGGTRSADVNAAFNEQDEVSDEAGRSAGTRDGFKEPARDTKHRGPPRGLPWG